MLTGILAVRNALLGEKNDLWSVNADREYHEEIRATPGADSPAAPGGVLGMPARPAGKVKRAA
jgi:hypothetical protein